MVSSHPIYNGIAKRKKRSDLKRKLNADFTNKFSLQEIQENKRPEGTRLVPKQEQDVVLQELWDRKKQLHSGIEQMSVTQFTTRA